MNDHNYLLPIWSRLTDSRQNSPVRYVLKIHFFHWIWPKNDSIQNSIPGEVVFEADDIVSSFEIEMLVRQEIRNLLDLLLPGAFFSEDKEIEILDFLDNKSFDNVEKLNLEQKSISVFRDQYSKFQVLQKDKSNYNLSYKISNSPKNGSLILDDKFIYFIPNS